LGRKGRKSCSISGREIYVFSYDEGLNGGPVLQIAFQSALPSELAALVVNYLQKYETVLV
jgi:hypothetical protein